AAALLASVSIAKLSAQEAAHALTGFAPPAGRGQVEVLPLPAGGAFALVDDSYNANPTSMRAALKALSARPAKRRLVALGEMGELGEGAPAFHAALADPVVASGAERVFLAGAGMENLATALPSTIQQHWQVKAEELLNVLKDTLCDGDTLLIKGSNASGMVKLAEQLRQWSASGGQVVMDRSVEDTARGL
ncbi:MAG: cyanophycin synthetase, partial [Pseudomonadota bacterium]